MDAPDLARLALIISKRPDAGGEVNYEFGTGYFVTSRLVLTASHAIPEDAVEVWARLESTGGRHQADVAEGKVKPAWRDARIDAVLLRVSPGLAQAEPVAWMDALPESDVPWRTTGYPDAASETIDDHTRFTTAVLKGMLYSQGGGGQGQRELELTVDAPAQKEGWRGVSGAPVFVGEKLAGIIRQAVFEGGRLRALPAPVLLAVAGFREAVEPQWLDWPGDQRWMLVLKSGQGTRELENRAKAALKTFNATYLPVTGGEAFQEEPVVARIEDALGSPGKWLQLVKALCAAPVMVADVTRFQPGVMVALGVRAVVRRAVTLTSTADRYDETTLRQLPFNIQETKLTFHGGKFAPKDPNNPVTVISQAIRDGLLESRLHSRYLDLPAYDAVRCPIPETAVGLQAARESVLVLCSFQPDYSDNWKAVSDSLLTYYAPKQPLRMLDLGSPRLVGQALYEYIRWAGTCIVDWTWLHLAESIRAYDAAWEFESGDYGVVNSYGMLNRLVSRLLLNPDSLFAEGETDFGKDLRPLAIRAQLQGAGQRIEAQLARPRRDDYWAMADLALVNVLLEKQEAISAYAGFLDKSPPDYAFKSVLDVLRPLAALKWKLADPLMKVTVYLDQRAPSRQLAG